MEYNPIHYKGWNLTGLANDQWDLVAPDETADPYKTPCPCGCGKMWKYCLPNLEEHYERFIHNFIEKYKHDNP